MVYSKQNWADGQTITAAKLNAMDDAIFGASASIPAVKYDGNISQRRIQQAPQSDHEWRGRVP